MRAIKYRGKKFNNEWVYGSLITDKSVNVIGEEFDVAFITGNLPYHEDSGEVWLKKMRRVKTYTIGQYIGWHDKNGQEIYEGASTSANLSGQPSAMTFGDISEEIKNAVDYVVQLYHDSFAKPKCSTIIKLNEDNTFEILRQ